MKFNVFHMRNRGNYCESEAERKRVVDVSIEKLEEVVRSLQDADTFDSETDWIEITVADETS
jgi:hypothetical protein